jgi:hypothetical protein
MIELGWKPQDCNIILAKGEDWIVSVTPKSGAPAPDYPPGTTVKAIFYPYGQNTTLPLGDWTVIDTWDANVSSDSVTWNVDHVDADAIPDRSIVRIEISYPNTPTDDVYTWMKGRVNRYD